MEFEEICIANSTLSHKEYLDCRELNLSIEVFHNSGMFKELQGLLLYLGISWFELIYQSYNKVRKQSHVLNELYNKFREASSFGLWDTQDELLEAFHQDPEKIINNTDGTNEMVMGKALAVFNYQQELHELIYSEAKYLIKKVNKWSDVYDVYLDDLKQISLMKKNDFLSMDKQYSFDTNFDLKGIQSHDYLVDPDRYFMERKNRIDIQHTPGQSDLIQTYIKQYGCETIEGKGRILMRAPIHELYRTAVTHHGS
ncbi:hypothetical protein A3761_15085 [Oleiphilus sp. HI0123]|nr:hypothetical protein A3761_15085 [Oleiphilus sp. HI0123]